MKGQTGEARVIQGNGFARPGQEAAGRYLYGFVGPTAPQVFSFPGIAGSPAYLICHGPVAAVVSDVANQKIRPERRHLAAHQDVLRRLMAQGPVLPMSFGNIADGPRAVQRILARNQAALLKQLKRVGGKEEMGLRVTWDVPNIFDYFITTHAELREARDRYFGGNRAPTQEDKIELGRMFDRLLNEDRQAYTESVKEILSDCSFEIQGHPPRNEREVMNLACLVGKDDQARFEAGVFEAARLFDDNFAFDYNGPWAPASFVELELEF
jgi:hypothetical protein